MKSAVIFDVDGVLLDTVPYHFKAWHQLFAEEGYTFTHKDYLEKVNGLPRETGIKNVLTNITKTNIKKLTDRKQQYFMEHIAKSMPQPLPGVVSFLNALKTRDTLIGAASSSKNAPALLMKAGIAHHFSIIISGADFKQSKPHPEIFILASQRLSINPESCTVIEDSYHGVQAAKNAKMRAIGVLSSNDEKIASLADFVVDSLKDYERCLEFLYE
jgi:beta-phosphoglucomutase